MVEKYFENYLNQITNSLYIVIDKFVIIGGSAVYIYHLMEKTLPSLLTFDIDLLKKENKTDELNFEEEINKLGFKPEYGEKGMIKYVNEEWRNETGRYFEIEFIVPLKGRGKTVGYIGKNFVAQSLRYTDLLLKNTLSYRMKNGVVIQIPHPARFIIQKLLSCKDRMEQTKQHNDYAYIADIVNIFFNKRNEIIEEILNLYNSPRKIWIKKAIRKYSELFGEKKSEGIIYSKELLKNISEEKIYSQAKIMCENLQVII